MDDNIVIVVIIPALAIDLPPARRGRAASALAAVQATSRREIELSARPRDADDAAGSCGAS